MHQSSTEPREAPKRQGKLTREQQKAVAEKRENTKGADISGHGQTLQEAAGTAPKLGSGDAYDNSSGDRSIQRGANDRGDHHK